MQTRLLIRRGAQALLLGALALLVGCGGGGGGGGSGGAATTFTFAFTPAPGGAGCAGCVQLRVSSATSTQIILEVVVRGALNDVFSAGFDLRFDDLLLDWVQVTEGDLLDSDGAATAVLGGIDGANSDVLVVGAARLAPAVTGVNLAAAQEKILVQLRFQALAPGTVALVFEDTGGFDSTLLDSGSLEILGGAGFFAGTLEITKV